MPEKRPEYGNKHIEITITLWANRIAPTEGYIVPKVCWERGAVALKQNKTHGLEPQTRRFSSIAHISKVVEDLLRSSGVKVIPGKRVTQLYSTFKQVRREL